jgi:hypothetical protein
MIGDAEITAEGSSRVAASGFSSSLAAPLA